jgi:hypothetical protein
VGEAEAVSRPADPIRLRYPADVNPGYHGAPIAVCAVCSAFFESTLSGRLACSPECKRVLGNERLDVLATPPWPRPPEDGRQETGGSRREIVLYLLGKIVDRTTPQSERVDASERAVIAEIDRLYAIEAGVDEAIRLIAESFDYPDPSRFLGRGAILRRLYEAKGLTRADAMCRVERDRGVAS